MRDLHSHLLPGVDDGVKEIEMSKAMLDKAVKMGFTDIIFTPHYVEDSKYTSNKNTNIGIFNEVKKHANKIGIKIYLGNEVYINYNILELLKKKEIMTLNDSRYMLIELPMTTLFKDAKSVFFELLNNGIIPILAHPERYIKHYNDLDFFIDLRSKGVLMQLNYPSLTGMFGSKAKKMAKKLLKADLISFVGSDTHHIEDGRHEIYEKAIKKLNKIVGPEKTIQLTEKNFMKVINDEEV